MYCQIKLSNSDLQIRLHSPQIEIKSSIYLNFLIPTQHPHLTTQTKIRTPQTCILRKNTIKAFLTLSLNFFSTNSLLDDTIFYFTLLSYQNYPNFSQLN